MELKDDHDERTRLLAMINGNWMTQAIGTAAVLDLPRLLKRSPCSTASLATATGCHAASLGRLLRALTSVGVCTQRDDGCFALTSLGALLDPDGPASLHAWARLRLAQWADWGELEASVRNGAPHRRRRLGCEDFTQLDVEPQRATLFHRAMTELTCPVAAGVVEALEFSGNETVVDVGGGSGEMLLALLAEYPNMRGAVFDLVHARDGALARFDEGGLADRCEFIVGSFFEDMPAGRDAYLLKSVLHDWDDERAALILRRCRGAMSANARMLVVERVVPEHWEDCTAHRAIAGSDLNMLVALSGRERTEAEFSALLAAASLRLVQVTAISVHYCVLEVAPC